jgi:hypothetical protein
MEFRWKLEFVTRICDNRDLLAICIFWPNPRSEHNTLSQKQFRKYLGLEIFPGSMGG